MGTLLYQIIVLSLSSLCLAQPFQNGSFEVHIDNGTLTSVIPLAEVKSLNLSGLQLGGVKPEAFDNATLITSLDLSNNQFNVLPENVFSKLSNLEQFIMKNNAYQLIITSQFANLKQLKLIDLTDSDYNFNPNSFVGMSDDCEIKGENTFTSLKPDRFGFNETLQFGKRNLAQSNCTDAEPIYKNLLKKQTDLTEQLENFNSESTNSLGKFNLCFLDGTVEQVGLVENCSSLPSIPRVLFLSNRNIRNFNKNWYQISDESINALVLDNNELIEISESLLNELPQTISSVLLRENRIHELKNNIIENNKIIRLDLSCNKISKIENRAFEKTTLKNLNLQENNLEEINFISGLPTSIIGLNLGGNRISTIPDNIFANLNNLLFLNLGRNKIKTINGKPFGGLRQLAGLTISNNELEKIEKGPFDDLQCIQALDFSSNGITLIDKGFASKMNNLRMLSMSPRVDVVKFERGLFYGLPSDSVVYPSVNVRSVEVGIFRKH